MAHNCSIHGGTRPMIRTPCYITSPPRDSRRALITPRLLITGTGRKPAKGNKIFKKKVHLSAGSLKSNKELAKIKEQMSVSSTMTQK
ncbi:hypothetical protein E2C01_051447 [Portunus trituberculatus]|uniref:Uncharacterized protein n=1 Tax=Portunus trituberculatus TaxID=210409 RepID=A0A5B7GJK2_PORTR|nr:hypothetical protein [Portunus trituberculatus]